MARLAVQVTANGELDVSSPSRAYQRIADSVSNGCDSSKQKAAEIADEWEQRAERANEVGHVTEFLRGNTVQLDESDCSEQEQLWRQLTEHAKQQRKQGLGPSQEARTRKDWRLRQLGEIEWKL